MRLGGRGQEKLFLEGEVLAHHHQISRQEELRASSCGSYHPATGLRGPPHRTTIPRPPGPRPLRPTEGPLDPPPRPQIEPRRNRSAPARLMVRRLQLPSQRKWYRVCYRLPPPPCPPPPRAPPPPNPPPRLPPPNPPPPNVRPAPMLEKPWSLCMRIIPPL